MRCNKKDVDAELCAPISEAPIGKADEDEAGVSAGERPPRRFVTVDRQVEGPAAEPSGERVGVEGVRLTSRDGVVGDELAKLSAVVKKEAF